MGAIMDRERFGFYSRANLMLVEGRVRAMTDLADRWQEEASAAAVDGNPARARHIETMTQRLVFGVA